MEGAQANLYNDPRKKNLSKLKKKRDIKTKIYYAIKNIFKKQNLKSVELKNLENEILARGFRLSDF